MNGTTWICCVLLLLLVLHEQQKYRVVVRQHIRKKRTGEERKQMRELAKQFIGKQCLVYTIKSDTIQGTLREVGDGGLLLESGGTVEAVNLDYVVRLREYPKKKNGKKKSVVWD